MFLQNSVLLAGLIASSITDLKTREVPDWINYSLIAAGIGLNMLASLILQDYHFILFSIIGFAVFFALSHIMYYTGQWGGGDAKMLIAIGAILGLGFTTTAPFISPHEMIISFLMNLLIAGFFYGMASAGFIALLNRKKFARQLKKDMKRYKILRISAMTIAGLTLISSFFIDDIRIKFSLVILGSIVALSFYLWLFGKIVENACMYKLVKPEQLTEGDWIARDIIVGKKRISGPSDLGIEKKQIAQLLALQKKGKIKRVLIKEGIPFVPSFLIAFLMTLTWGNVLLIFI